MNITIKNARNAYLNPLDDSHRGAGLFVEHLNFFGSNVNNCPLPHNLLQKNLLPPITANNNGSINSIIPSHANSMLKKPNVKYITGHSHKYEYIFSAFMIDAPSWLCSQQGMSANIIRNRHISSHSRQHSSP